ncbi:hypothetical protein C9374_008916 [Naegleria lovaniensis]|uniref:Xrn1 N-terminal domain-containing protein n=1 Tax=Naegleria lovaniensis TaxID=51637 RepID=A0AA88KH51_NAELO|nr:uncharacterized protein C9374_008916 [Naegleria lovaniensis]KAG2377831.1 hypothetical protein C9374_008916 [Naegleria lovaniensis]
MGVPSFMSQLNSIINSLYQQEHIGARYQQIISNVTNERKNNVKKGSSQSSSSSSTIFDCIYIDINPLIHGVVRGVQNSIDATNSSTTETSHSKKSSSQNKSESSSSQKDSKKSSSSRPQDSKKSSSQNKSTTTDNTCDDKIVRGVIKSLEEVMTNFKAQTHWFISFDGVATKSKRIKQRSNRAKESKKRNGEKKNMSSSDSVDITENHHNPVDIHTNNPVDMNHTNDPVDISENHTNHPMDITENHTNVPNDEIMLDLADEEMSDDENNDNGTLPQL